MEENTTMVVNDAEVESTELVTVDQENGDGTLGLTVIVAGSMVAGALAHKYVLQPGLKKLKEVGSSILNKAKAKKEAEAEEDEEIVLEEYEETEDKK